VREAIDANPPSVGDPYVKGSELPEPTTNGFAVNNTTVFPDGCDCWENNEFIDTAVKSSWQETSVSGGTFAYPTAGLLGGSVVTLAGGGLAGQKAVTWWRQQLDAMAKGFLFRVILNVSSLSSTDTTAFVGIMTADAGWTALVTTAANRIGLLRSAGAWKAVGAAQTYGQGTAVSEFTQAWCFYDSTAGALKVWISTTDKPPVLTSEPDVTHTCIAPNSGNAFIVGITRSSGGAMGSLFLDKAEIWIPQV